MSDTSGLAGAGEQLWLDHQFTQSVRATRSTPGFDKNLNFDFQQASEAFGSGVKVDIGHPDDKPFALTRAGEISEVRGQPAAENRSLGATRDKAAVAEAARKGAFKRLDNTDVGAPKGVRNPRLPEARWRAHLRAWKASARRILAPAAPEPETTSPAVNENQLSLPGTDAPAQKSVPDIESQKISTTDVETPKVRIADADVPKVRVADPQPPRVCVPESEPIEVGGLAEGAATVGGVALLGYNVYKAKTAEAKVDVVVNAIKDAPVGVAISEVGLGSVAIPLVAIEGTKVLMKENVIPESTQRAIGKAVVEKAFGASTDDIDLLEHLALPAAIPLIDGWRPFAPN